MDCWSMLIVDDNPSQKNDKGTIWGLESSSKDNTQCTGSTYFPHATPGFFVGEKKISLCGLFPTW